AWSIRSMRLSVRLGAHTLPKPVARPEPGLRPTATLVAILLVRASTRTTLSLPALEIQTASGPIASQSGAPLMESLAITGSEVTRTELRSFITALLRFFRCRSRPSFPFPWQGRDRAVGWAKRRRRVPTMHQQTIIVGGHPAGRSARGLAHPTKKRPHP